MIVGCVLPASTKYSCFEYFRSVSMTPNLLTSTVVEKQSDRDETTDDSGVTDSGQWTDSGQKLSQNNTGTALLSASPSSDSFNKSSNSSAFVKAFTQGYPSDISNSGKALTFISTGFAGGLAVAVSFAIYKVVLRVASRKRARSRNGMQLNPVDTYQTLNIGHLGRRYEQNEIPALITPEPHDLNDQMHKESSHKVIPDEPSCFPPNVPDTNLHSTHYCDMTGHASSENTVLPSSWSREVVRAEIKESTRFKKRKEHGHMEEASFEKCNPNLNFHMYTPVKGFRDTRADAHFPTNDPNPTYENWPFIKEDCKPISTTNGKVHLSADMEAFPGYINLNNRTFRPVHRSQASSHNFPLPPPVPTKLHSQVERKL